MALNLAQLLTDSAERAPTAPAIQLGDASLDYLALDDLSDRFAGFLQGGGLAPGDRVGLMLPNIPEFAIAYFGILKAGGVIVPMNTLLKSREVAFYLADSGARILVAWADVIEEARAGAHDAGVEAVIAVGETTGPPVSGDLYESIETAPAGRRLVPRAADDTAVILYTSGTTGRPKGAELSHSNLLWNAQVASELFEIRQSDVILGTLPLFHSFGQTCALNTAMRRAATLVVIPRFEAERVLDVIETERISVFLGVPTMYVGLLNAPSADGRDLRCLRLCVSGGASLPVEVLQRFERNFEVRVLEGYGLSETSPVASFNHLDRASKPGSIGTPIWGTEMRLAGEGGEAVPSGEVGEIIIRGHNVMRGYWQRPEETAAAIDAEGWLRTGDMARVDEDGYFFIVDRKKELVIRGGYNVYPREIEEVIYEHPDVLEVAVIGIPHAELGEEVAAAVVPKPGAALDPQEVIEWTKGRVAAYKYPRRVVILDELPKGPTGKILKREIDRAALAVDEAPAPVAIRERLS